MPQTSFWRAGAVIPLLAALAYLPALAGVFVYDDTLLVADNIYVHDGVYWKRAFSTHFWDVSASGSMTEPMRYYRPLVTLSYLTDWLLSAGQAWWFHLTNVLVHTLNTWLVLIIGRRWTRHALLGAACALLFAFHPTRAEAVTWVSGRPDPLMTLFVLLTVQLAHLGERKPRHVPAALGIAAAFTSALLCKEPALAAPLLLGVGALTAAPGRRTWHVMMTAVTVALGGVYLGLRHVFLQVGAPPLEWTPLHALVTVTHYVERIVFPWPLTFFYQVPEVGPAGPVHSPLDVAAGGFLLALFLGVCVHAWRRDRPAFVLLVAAAAFIGPLLNLFQTGSKFTAADRFLYLPLWLFLLGLCRLFNAPLLRLLEPTRHRLAGAGILAVYVALLTTRALDFTSGLAFWNSELRLNPDNPMALRARAAHYTAHGEQVLAIADLAHSLRRESLRFRTLAAHDGNTDAYGRLVALRAQQLPDGAVGALQALAADAVDRLAGQPRTGRAQDLGIDWPPDGVSVRWAGIRGERILAGHLVPLSTRLDVHDVSLALLDAIPDRQLHATPNPLLIAIGEGREQRFDRARSRIATMKAKRALMPSVVTDAAIADVEHRVRSAEQDFTSSSAIGGTDHFARMKAFATLGAYGRALMEAPRVNPRPPDFGPLYVELLVFARLESAALGFASQALGQEGARTTVESIRRHLPPELLAIPALESPTAASADPSSSR
jgi:hypothetical protein